MLVGFVQYYGPMRKTTRRLALNKTTLATVSGGRNGGGSNNEECGGVRKETEDCGSGARCGATGASCPCLFTYEYEGCAASERCA